MCWDIEALTVALASEACSVGLNITTGDFTFAGQCGSGGGFCYTRYLSFADNRSVKEAIAFNLEYPEFAPDEPIESTRSPGFTVLPEGREVHQSGGQFWVNARSLVGVSELETIYLSFPDRRLVRVCFQSDDAKIEAESGPMPHFSMRTAVTGDGHFGACRTGGIDFFDVRTLELGASWLQAETTTDFGEFDPVGLQGAALVYDKPTLRVISTGGICLTSHDLSHVNPTRFCLSSDFLYVEAIVPSELKRSIWRLPVYFT